VASTNSTQAKTCVYHLVVFLSHLTDTGVLAHEDNSLTTEGLANLLHLLGAHIVHLQRKHQHAKDIEYISYGNEIWTILIQSC